MTASSFIANRKMTGRQSGEWDLITPVWESTGPEPMEEVPAADQGPPRLLGGNLARRWGLHSTGEDHHLELQHGIPAQERSGAGPGAGHSYPARGVPNGHRP